MARNCFGVDAPVSVFVWVYNGFQRCEGEVPEMRRRLHDQRGLGRTRNKQVRDTAFDPVDLRSHHDLREERVGHLKREEDSSSLFFDHFF